MNAREYVNKYQDDIINDIKELVAIKSVEEEPKEGMPFGEGPAKALCKALEIAEKYGFKTANLDNYAGYAEMGEGEDVIGILAHVDVVPEGEGWEHEPYNVHIVDGMMYGRGVADDKGPAIVALHAMRVVREMGIPMNKRVRLVFGANEETGMKCVAHYKEIEGGFTMGFSPDGSFPLIFGEKGSFGADFTAQLNAEGAKTVIEDFFGGEARNVVCPKVTVVLSGEKLDEIKVAFEAYGKANDLPTDATEADGKLTLVLTGKPAHASTPHLGRNSISYMVDFLNTVLPESPFVKGYVQCVGLGYDGEKMGAKCEDEYGVLTMNIGIISVKDGKATATIDIRYPITVDFAPYVENIRKSFEDAGCEIDIKRVGASLFVDPNSEFIKVLHKSYVEVTGDTVNQPYTIGGGTYSKAFENVVAFGNEYPGEENCIHMADERILVSRLFDSCEIYAKAIENLLAL
ncbi:MAG: dipeptidase PepV [Anaerofustis stercorihominis]|nr:dipeptidase PepV [Anaerofustis stercorihominis]